MERLRPLLWTDLLIADCTNILMRLCIQQIHFLQPTEHKVRANRLLLLRLMGALFANIAQQ